ncbi:MAG: 50S ribosomal protein L34e [Candidatus Woesearchaeota archaeon]|jgi:large subunit ribosomal protein L34e|nr:50S ribosomal protein L34e [archaeon]MDP6548244.1 50S ribosomal protein L34e [Candidatus Woesearchaeota archaeon]MDP7263226.1 50S ribosomal protein L34e [Candidatus Woesearchaeota archaeon]MDP7623005.1 50S ribosomal protein L34e [Candidatus Woesearchaeota archaeon]HJN56641.1 50S ribosomal protein L34e [Candidatus Woesearchaeota archaeon]|tara:strand:- start:5132 stop:5401 length:270 start_codon:yes stop_codon:yes gene_type:complete
MVERFKRSRSLRKVKVKVPGGSTVVHYRRRKPKGAKCGNCSATLKGIPRERPIKMTKMAKTKKRPERPYGGNLCSRCMRSLIVERVRSQ